jgi:tungstate transport system substrate-binding protein
MKKLLYITILIILFIFLIRNIFLNQKKEAIIVASTTSLVDTGVLERLAEEFNKSCGIIVKLLAVGSGQALELAKKQAVDLVIIHSPKDKEKFINQGFGKKAYPFIWNYFLLLGPKDGAVGVEDSINVREVFKRIYSKRAIFVSRGDNSGTYKKELEIWQSININPQKDKSYPYIQTGQGMASTLFIASQKQAYTISDSSTYYLLKEKIDLIPLLKFDRNVYHIIELNPTRLNKINYKLARKFIEFLLSNKSKDIINQEFKTFYWIK